MAILCFVLHSSIYLYQNFEVNFVSQTDKMLLIILSSWKVEHFCINHCLSRVRFFWRNKKMILTFWSIKVGGKRIEIMFYPPLIHDEGFRYRSHCLSWTFKEFGSVSFISYGIFLSLTIYIYSHIISSVSWLMLTIKQSEFQYDLRESKMSRSLCVMSKL